MIGTVNPVREEVRGNDGHCDLNDRRQRGYMPTEYQKREPKPFVGVCRK
jgi:hypothetical protein